MPRGAAGKLLHRSDGGCRCLREPPLEVLDSDYMLLAESKGITGRPLLVRHALRKRADPDHYGTGAAGCRSDDWFLVIEKIFLTRASKLMIAAIQSNDYNVTIGIIYSVMHCPDAGGCRPVRTNYRPENPSGEEIGLRGDGMKNGDEKTDEK